MINLVFISLSCSNRSDLPVSRQSAESRARKIVEAMDDRTAASQILLTGIDGASSLSPASAAALHEAPPGGVMLFKYNLGKGSDAARLLTTSVSAAIEGSLRDRGVSPVPPFVAVDHEGGRVHRFGDDATRLPAAAAFGALGKDARAVCEEAAFLSGSELRSLGVNLNLAPVAELSDAESEQFLGDRAYGSDPETVSAAAGGFVAGMRRAGIACVVKHFPGNAAADPHKSLPTINADKKRLDELLRPFALVFSGDDPAAVMVSHAIVSALDPDSPASLSRAVIEEELRKRLGFDGMVVSDDLRMGAIAATGRKPPQAAVEAVAAGVDLVMTWTGDLVAVRDALVGAVADGSLSRARLDQAATRVIAAKIRYGVFVPDDAPEGAPAKAPGAPSGGETEPANPRAAEIAALRAETQAYLKKWGFR